MNLPGVYNTFLRRWENYQTVWVISDTHFGDEELAAGMPDRLYKEHLVKLINSKVGRKDVLIHLGDVGDIEFAKQLRGYKVLVMGNHDAGRTNYEGVFNEIYEGPVMLGEKLLLSHEPIQVPWAFNLHGHDHQGKHLHKGGMNVCIDADGMGYCPINLNQALKNGLLSKVETIHRATINTATIKKAKRGGRKIGEKK